MTDDRRRYFCSNASLLQQRVQVRKDTLAFENIPGGRGVSEIFANPAVAIDQDALGKQGDRLYQSGDLDVWTKPLSGGRVAVGLFNRSWDNRDVSVDLGEIGFESGANLRDVWKETDLGRHTGVFTDTIPKHGVSLLIVSK